MERIGIREMRQNLSQYTRRARAGESFLITDRGAEVARLIPAASLATRVDRLVAERGARRGHGDLLTLVEHLAEPITGPSTSEVLDEIRAERF